MVKIDILGDLLYEKSSHHEVLSSAERQISAAMIDDSDNTSAQELWNDIGGFGLSTKTSGTGGYYAIQSFNHQIGFTETATNWGWGLMATTPHDFLALLRAIWLPGRVLTTTDRSYEQGLMRNVVPSQRFGIPSGPPKTAVVGVKNGWYPEPTGWQLNSAGYVHFSRTTYLAVIMTAYNPNEAYGLSTLNTLGSLLWRYEYHNFH